MQAPGKPTLHPMLWVAAIAITLFSLVGIGALTGVIGKPTPKAEEAVATAPASVPGQAAPESASPSPALAEAEKAAQAAPAPSTGPARRTTSGAAASTERSASRSHTADEYPPATPVNLCATCGVVESVRTVAAKGEGTGVGAVAGGVLGGALGNQIGKGSGNTLATIAGAVAGGYAGHQVEKNMRSTTHYEITVRMEDGERRVLTRRDPPVWRQGDRVEVSPNGELTAARSGGRANF